MLKAFPAVAWRENSLLAAARGGYRAGAFVALSVSRPLRPVFRRNPEIPTRRTTPGLAASVLIDEIVIGVLPRALLSSDPDWLARARDDTEVTVAAAERNGWLHDPASFYRTPPPPAVVVVEPARFHHIRHELLSFDTGYEPPLGLAGGDRWLAIEQNRRVEARVLRHRGGARPWLFVLHGYTGGTPADMVALRALHFH